MDTTASLEALQTDEQRLVLDTVAQIRKCGLESILSLPQLVVCGDQSSGKSSVLEALTEIPFPRADNLCTRFATEIILRRASEDSLTIKVIPDADRNTEDQESIRAFSECITDLAELPNIIEKAKAVMGIDVTNAGSQSKAFAKDVLSIEIEGPSRPQLTLVDLPGLIQNETKRAKDADIELVKGMTQKYISQPRTICLAVISALHDYANQGILQRIRKVDPEGERTVGIITKPDRLDPKSGSEQAFLELALNKDIFLKLGWSVLKNRKFEEEHFSFQQRNASEAEFFRTSIFRELPKDSVGIDALRSRLSLLLFEHVKRELPKLKDDLEKALTEASKQLETMGKRRATPQECKELLISLSLGYHEICQAAVNGNYEGEYFTHSDDRADTSSNAADIRRLRAMIQLINAEFAKTIHTKGHRYYIEFSDDAPPPSESDNPRDESDGPPLNAEEVSTFRTAPKRNGFGTPGDLPTWGTLSKSQALQWVSRAIVRSRGRELPGNFNPLVIGELFWEQSSDWHRLAVEHVEEVVEVCTQFLDGLLQEKCPKDIYPRIWSSQFQDALTARSEAALRELDMIMEDIKSYPINYNHYYTETVRARRAEREKPRLKTCLQKATSAYPSIGGSSKHRYTTTSTSIDVGQALDAYHAQSLDANLQQHSGEEVLDYMLAIYKVRRQHLRNDL